MKRLFGAKKPAPPPVKAPSLEETSGQLGTRGKVLEGKIKECEKQLNEVKQQMKTQKGVAYKNSQKKALMILKRRKVYENQLGNLLNQQFNVDQVKFTTETIQTTVDTAGALKSAAAAQKEQMKKINLDELEDLQDDITDMMEEQEEIQEVLSRDYTVNAYDEEELQQELEELDTDIVNEKLEGEEAAPSYLPQKTQEKVHKEKGDLDQIMNQ